MNKEMNEKMNKKASESKNLKTNVVCYLPKKKIKKAEKEIKNCCFKTDLMKQKQPLYNKCISILFTNKKKPILLFEKHDYYIKTVKDLKVIMKLFKNKHIFIIFEEPELLKKSERKKLLRVLNSVKEKNILHFHAFVCNYWKYRTDFLFDDFADNILIRNKINISALEEMAEDYCFLIQSTTNQNALMKTFADPYLGKYFELDKEMRNNIEMSFSQDAIDLQI